MSIRNTPWWEQYKVNLPESVSGKWRIERFQVEELSLENIRMAIHGERPVLASTYTRLLFGSSNIVMSDTPDEVSGHLEVIRQARGRVLLAGLGLGMVLKAILTKSKVGHVDVVEISKDVLNLVSPHYRDSRVVFHYGDIFTFRFPRGSHWDVAWFDIWPNKCSDYLPQMTKLKRRYARAAAWRGCWAEREMRIHQRRGW